MTVSRRVVSITLMLVLVMVAVVLIGFRSAGAYTIPVIVIGAFFAATLLRFSKDFLHPAVLLSGVYALNSALAVFFDRKWLYGFAINDDPLVIFSYAALVVALLVPSLFIRRYAVDKIDNQYTFQVIIRWSWPLIIYAAIYLAPFAIASYQSGALSVRSQLSEEASVLPSTFLTTLAVGTAFFYPLFIFLWFYTRISKMHKFYQAMMLIGAFLGVESSIVFAARDRLIWVPAFFVFGLWYWWAWLSARARRALFRVAIMVAACAGSVLFLFTVDRFGNTEFGTLGSILLYYGNQPYVFAERVLQQTDFYGISLRFPIVAEFLGIHRDIRRVTPYEWQFGTLLSDFYAISGWTSLIFISVALCFGFSVIFRGMGRRGSGFRLIALILYFQIVLQGVFYFSLGNQGGNLYLLMMGVLAILSRYDSKFSTRAN